mmetsp:Transcript_37265/g.58236  ORF Transcript_37265/g.58236 Transcript_37265/m.58236 type:complete len:141 (+) Transcript_37265:111-533(+)
MSRAELRTAIKHLKHHFTGRNGNPTGDPAPYAAYLVNLVRQNAQAPAAEATELRKDLLSYSYYLDAMIQKKTLLSSFGGDNVRGISARQRIENTSERVGLKLPEQHENQAEQSEGEYAKKLGMKEPKSIREDLNDIVNKK